jgi:lipopolysaccharide biosynthesis protein
MQDTCFFAHYDNQDRLADYVWYGLEELRKCGFDIIFVSTSDLDQVTKNHLRTLCTDVIVRENAGLDFGSWCSAFQKHGGNVRGRLLLLNDSVYGPLFSLQSTLADLTRRSADFYGMVESLDITPHLQSWFVLFENRVISHPALGEALMQPFGQMTKREIIEQGEIGLSQRLVAAGFRYEALYKASCAGRVAQSVPVNPMHHLWREMIQRYQVPFLKVELLRDNPARVYDLDLAKEVVSAHSPVLWGLIEAHQTSSSAMRRIQTAPLSVAGRVQRRTFQHLLANDDALHNRKSRGLALLNYGLFQLLRSAVSAYRAVKSMPRPFTSRLRRDHTRR